MKQRALSLLDAPLLAVLHRWRDWMKKKRKDYERYLSALDYATRKHAGQKRMGGDEYITHPVAVAELLREQLYPVEYQIAGLFHDLLEDTDATVEEIKALSNQEVAEAVRLLTKEKGYKMDAYVARIKSDPIAKAVKSADRYHNLLCADAADEAFKKSIFWKALSGIWTFLQLISILGKQLKNWRKH